jgi:hypothetical protein
MNIFQKQLIFNDGRTMTQTHNDLAALPRQKKPTKKEKVEYWDDPDYMNYDHLQDYAYLVGQLPLAPSEQKTTMEEFEKTMQEIREKKK